MIIAFCHMYNVTKLGDLFDEPQHMKGQSEATDCNVSQQFHVVLLSSSLGIKTEEDTGLIGLLIQLLSWNYLDINNSQIKLHVKCATKLLWSCL